MARKAKPKFDKSIIVEAFAEMARERGIDRDALQSIIKETLSMLVRKKYGERAEFDIVVNMDKGDIEIYRIMQVVETVEDPVLELAQSEANQGVDQYDIGDEFRSPSGEHRRTNTQSTCTRCGTGQYQQLFCRQSW
jgi:hypothetical protein